MSTREQSLGRLARGATIEAIVADRPFEVGFNRNPLKPVETVKFTSTTDDVGLLTYHVRVVPNYNAPDDTLHGYRVEQYHEKQEDATIIEKNTGLEEALDIAADQLDRLVE